MSTIREICEPYVAEAVKAAAMPWWFWLVLGTIGILLSCLAFYGGWAVCMCLERNIGQRAADSFERNSLRLNSLGQSQSLISL
jgi:hypothetical protein